MTILAPSSPRALLRALREVLAQKAGAQARLDRVVKLVASAMAAEVCSIYVLRTDELLELAATIGLNPNAVHNARLRVGEGLVGTVANAARALNLTDAPAHPNFAYLPETGEDPFRSFLGVPILRGGRPRGVLVVQNQIERQYADEDVEALETVAMVLAEMLAATEFLEMRGAEGTAAQPDIPLTLHGITLAPGVATGTAVLHEPRVRITKLIAEDVASELARLEDAVNALRASIDQTLRRDDPIFAGTPLEVMETYRMFAHDKGWLARLQEAVRSGLTAEAAVERVQNDTRAKMMRHRDRYVRERYSDLDDLANRLLRHLTGKAGAESEVAGKMILVAHHMGPADLLDYDHTKLAGVLVEEGTASSHVAIVARALNIPMLGGLADIADQVGFGDQVIVDAELGEVHIRPQAQLAIAFEQRLALSEERRARFEALRDLPAETMDGTRIGLMMNAGLLYDLPHLIETGADGIGLFRTELQFMISRTFPRLTAQTDLYAEVLDVADDKPVTFRTLDLGGDKILPYLEAAEEENPAMGWRALRFALDRPGLLRYQIRAMLAAGAGRELRLMFPMVAEVDEFVRARGLVDREIEWRQAHGYELPTAVQVGCMLEVPSLAWQLDALLPIVDFLSVGTNDLLQFMFAADRGNARVADRYDFLSPALLSLIRNVAQAADRHGVPVTICGEAAGKPLEAMALIGLGIRSLSVPAAAVGPVKLMVRGLQLSELEPFVGTLLERPDRSLREALKAFAEDNAIAL